MSGYDRRLDWNSLFPTPLTQILAEKPLKRDKYQTDFGSVSKGLLYSEELGGGGVLAYD